MRAIIKDIEPLRSSPSRKTKAGEQAVGRNSSCG